ncbi:MAG: gliding motility lipoprotein GldD [Bacteroidales bacterium]|nr:gliding motility lipoprotein GldD [Bacteroidales bacterium]
MFNKRLLKIFFSAYIIFFLCSCGNDNNFIPKPVGYLRLDLPAHSYKSFDTTYPYRFDYSRHARVVEDTERNKEIYWINIEYPEYKAKIYLSYKTVDDNLGRYIEDAHTFINKHIPKASTISESTIIKPGKRVFGTIYNIEGIGAASPLQFYLTDSTKKFIRGALYFNAKPNNDSLAPVIDYIKKDVERFIESFEWKKAGNQ